MTSFLPTLHFILICVWLGVVLVETVIEFSGRARGELRSAAELHYRIDLLVELPIVLGVAVTGVILLLKGGIIEPLMRVKVTAALVAIAYNLYCISLVVTRYQRREDPAVLVSTTNRILWCWIGVPFGLIAFYLGMHLAGML